MNNLAHPFRRWAVAVQSARFSLVEVLFACLILMILAVGGAAFLYHSIGMLAIQQSHRQALEVANSRLEDVRGSAYAALKPPALNYKTYYLSKVSADNWSVSSGDPDDQVLVNGTLMPMTTTVVYVDLDGGLSSYDALRVSVTVQYRGTADTVCLETLCAP